MKVLFSTVLAAVASIVMAQSSGEATLMTIDDKKISKQEFESIFKKNNRDSVITKEDLDEYSELFVNFKLKVAEAEDLGMDTLPQFIRELDGYRDQLARPYLVDKSTTDSLVEEAYQRSLLEVRASHILINIPANPSPADTVEAYNKIMAIKKIVMERPQDFGELARMRSNDPSARQNSGDLGYFSALQMVYPFESMIYETSVGEIGGPVRTQFGYHLVKVVDKRTARGKVRVSHIMIRVETGDPADVQETAQNRIDEIYIKLQEGGDFAELAKKYSDDRTSAGKGGDLPPFGTGKMVEEFEEASFALTTVGDITPPVKSPYGWHIIKLNERIGVGSYDDVEKELKARVAKDSRSFVSRDSFIEKRKVEYHFAEDRTQLKAFYKGVDTTYYKGKWEPSEKLKAAKKVLFTLDGEEYLQSDLLTYLVRNMRPTGKTTNIETMINEIYDRFVNQTVMSYEDSRLEDKYPEFKALMSEYRDGILLFDLTDQKVWSRAVKDSAGLADYYAANKSEYMWQERAAYDLYTVEDSKTGKAVLKMLKKGENQDEIKSALNEESALKVTVESGLRQKDDVPVFSEIVWAVGTYGVIEFEGQMFVVNVKEIQPSQPKAFDEARGLITAGYQNELETQWIEKLRSEHTISINNDVLYSIQ